jgi:hypothetical protein
MHNKLVCLTLPATGIQPIQRRTGPSLTSRHWTTLEKFARVKHSSTNVSEMIFQNRTPLQNILEHYFV